MLRLLRHNTPAEYSNPTQAGCTHPSKLLTLFLTVVLTTPIFVFAAPEIFVWSTNDTGKVILSHTNKADNIGSTNRFWGSLFVNYLRLTNGPMVDGVTTNIGLNRTNRLVTESSLSHLTNTIIAMIYTDTRPRAGIWGMDYQKRLGLLPLILESTAGYWKMNTNGEVVLSTNVWYDTWWTTNSIGEIIMRSLP